MAFAPLISFQMLVGVFDQDDRGIDHDPDGNGDTPQAHDVGIDVQSVHNEKGQQDTHGQGKNRHKRRAEMKQENSANKGHHAHFLYELLF